MAIELIDVLRGINLLSAQGAAGRNEREMHHKALIFNCKLKASALATALFTNASDSHSHRSMHMSWVVQRVVWTASASAGVRARS